MVSIQRFRGRFRGLVSYRAAVATTAGPEVAGSDLTVQPATCHSIDVLFLF